MNEADALAKDIAKYQVLLIAAVIAGFALLSLGLVMKKNDFESCYARLNPVVAKNQKDPDLAIAFTARACVGIVEQ